MSLKYWTQVLHGFKPPMHAVAAWSHPTRRCGRKKDGSRVPSLASRRVHKVQYVRHILAEAHTELIEHTISVLSSPLALPLPNQNSTFAGGNSLCCSLVCLARNRLCPPLLFCSNPMSLTQSFRRTKKATRKHRRPSLAYFQGSPGRTGPHVQGKVNAASSLNEPSPTEAIQIIMIPPASRGFPPGPTGAPVD